MLNIIENIDPINYIIQDVLNNIDGLELTARNNFYIGEGYSLDVQEVRKNSYKLKVRTSNLQDLCNIAFDKKKLIIRYSPEFFFVQDGTSLSTNLFEGRFSLDELPSAFSDNSTVFGLGVEFDHVIMMETIGMCSRIREDFLQKITK